LAQNEAVFRNVNEEISRHDLTQHSVGGEFVCECSQTACTTLISMSLAEYETLRQHAARFAVVPGHEDLEIERVVARTPAYVTVEKTGQGREVAAALDPRA